MDGLMCVSAALILGALAFLFLYWLRLSLDPVLRRLPKKAPLCPDCGDRCHKVAIADAGWALYWDCECGLFCGSEESEIRWPFGEDEEVSPQRLREYGFEIV